MKKIILVVAMMVASMSAYAGSSSNPQNEQENSGIVTPDVATGMLRIYSFNYDESMNILVCIDPYKYNYNNKSCVDNNGKNKWRYLSQVPPKNKKYVGFKSVSQGGSHFIEVYWK